MSKLSHLRSPLLGFIVPLGSPADGPVTGGRARLKAHRFLGVALLVAAMLIALSPAADASSLTISGTAFQDLNRDGSQQEGEAPFVDHLIYLYNETGSLLATQRTDARGRYSFTVTPGSYRVGYAPSAWRDVRLSWVPTNTASLFPEHLEIEAPAVADFAWRPISTSSTPIDEFIGPSGLRVQTFNDVLTARFLHDHVVAEFLIGEEAKNTTIRFARSSNMTNSIIYADHVRSTINVTYSSWLDNGDRMLAHEYGHAWTNHHTHVTQQDPSWTVYLEARGLADDSRVGTSYAWLPSEIAAEDYRQLFASENARSGGQINHEIPRPGELDGFERWMRETYTTQPGAPDPVEDDPPSDPGADPTTDPEPEPTEPEPAPDPGDGSDETDTKCHPRRGCDDGSTSTGGGSTKGNNGNGRK